jgi:hypothetical protein
MIMCSLSVMFTVIVLNFHYRGPETYRMPIWVSQVLKVVKKIESDYEKCMLDCMIACRKASPQDEQRPSGPRPAKLCSDK